MVLCNLYSAIFLLVSHKDNNDDALHPVSSAQYICRIAVMTEPDKIYCVICIKSTGEQVSMVTKPRTLGLFKNADLLYH